MATSTLGISGGSSTFTSLTDTQNSFTANRVIFTNSGATALTDSANFVFDGTNLGIGSTTPNTRLTIEAAEDTALLALSDSTNASAASLYVGTSSPASRLTALRGSLYIDTLAGALYQNTDGSTAWSAFVQGTTTHSARITKASQSIPATTFTKITFDTIDYDVGGLADVSTNNRIDIQRSGKYIVTASARSASVLNNGDAFIVGVNVNGTGAFSGFDRQGYSSNRDMIVRGTDILDLEAGDYIEVSVYHEGTTASFTTMNLSVAEVAHSGSTGVDLFTDAGGDTYLIATGDNLLVGTTTNAAAAKFVIRQQNANDIINVFDGSTEVFTILDGGDVGIGTDSPVQTLQVFGDIRVGDSGTNGCLERFDGTALVGTCASDQDLKTNIVALASSTASTTSGSVLERLVALTPVTYSWNETAHELYAKSMDTISTGLIAQNVEEYFPELVSRNEDDYRQVNFTALPYYIIQAIKEMWAIVTGHDERIVELETENAALEERLQVIEAELNIAATHGAGTSENNSGTDDAGSDNISDTDTDGDDSESEEPPEEDSTPPTEETDTPEEESSGEEEGSGDQGVIEDTDTEPGQSSEDPPADENEPIEPVVDESADLEPTESEPASVASTEPDPEAE